MIKAFGPLNTSTRSSASVAMICRGRTPYRPLKERSSVVSCRPRMENTCAWLANPEDWRTEASFSSTSPTLLACWSSISCEV
ncbi:hypothetical protein FQZ97_848050 [compost metagenome]